MCKNPLKRKVASQFLNVLAQFLTHYQHFCKKKKESDAAPKSEEGGDEKQLCFFMRPNALFVHSTIFTNSYFPATFKKNKNKNKKQKQCVYFNHAQYELHCEVTFILKVG